MSDLHAMPRNTMPRPRPSSAGGVMHVAPGRCGVRGCRPQRSRFRQLRASAAYQRREQSGRAHDPGRGIEALSAGAPARPSRDRRGSHPGRAVGKRSWGGVSPSPQPARVHYNREAVARRCASASLEPRRPPAVP
jgi:hypothetical protein